LWPTTNEAASDASHTTASATSSGRPSLRAGQRRSDGAHVGDARGQHHRGLDAARRHGVDAQAARGIFQRRRAGEGQHRSLGGGVERQPWVGIAQAAHRAVVDDDAAPGWQHQRDLRLHRQEQRPDVDVEDGVEDLVRLLGERRAPLLDAGIVEGDVEAAELVAGLLDGAADAIGIAEVDRDETGGAAGRPACRGGVVTAVGVAAEDGDVGAAPREGERGRPSDAGGSAGDQHRLARESRLGVHPPRMDEARGALLAEIAECPGPNPLQRRDAIAAFEVPVERALVVETRF
jgi:hypothetical protein